jgi:L-ascorbate metabolism protein UlaG (beta-lactamase superfamily)
MLALLIFVGLLVVIYVFAVLFQRTVPFGAPATGPRKKRILESQNYRDGQFQNLEHTPGLTEGVSMTKVFADFFFTRNPSGKPPVALPTIRTDLKNISRRLNGLAWFGHSSYLLLAEGKSFLVDPVFSGHASPFAFTTRSFAGTDIYTPDDFPRVDFLVLTHDHWDHLDYKTVTALRSKVGRIITGLGTGAHLERWGFPSWQIIELDWWQEKNLGDGFSIGAAPGRHFSGRTFRRNANLWTGFSLHTPKRKILLGGDSGYGKHYEEIGRKWGPFDLAILECGQYNYNWKYIHMMPEEVVQAAFDCKARLLLPVHWGKFSLALHDWDDPIRRCVAEAEKKAMPVLHPMIGEWVNLDEPAAQKKWWEGLGGS